MALFIRLNKPFIKLIATLHKLFLIILNILRLLRLLLYLYIRLNNLLHIFTIQVFQKNLIFVVCLIFETNKYYKYFRL